MAGEQRKKSGRVIAIPFPGQGHVNSLMSISKLLAKNGIRVTMINTEFVHNKLIGAMGEQSMEQVLGPNIELIALSDGLPLEDKRETLEKLLIHTMTNLKPKFEELFRAMSNDHAGPISCVIAGITMAWTLDIAEDLGIRGAIYTPFLSSPYSVLNFSINELIENGVIDSNGEPVEEKEIEIPGRITQSMLMHTRDLPWLSILGKVDQSIVFKYLVTIQRGGHYAKFFISTMPPVLEPEVISLHPKLLPIGPLTTDAAGQLWKEDTSCLQWLDRQAVRSVVYMAFGSSSIYSQKQFEEMAMGIQLSNRPFLWVVWPGTELKLPDGFNGEIGRIVSWVPQQKVLNHPSVGIFWTHCGCNSVLEGMTSGLPLLCQPYVANQLTNLKYITDVWKLGVGLEKNQDGIVSRWEIIEKLKQLEGDEGIKARSKDFAEKIKTCWELPQGLSAINFDRLLKWIKNQQD